MQWTIQAKCAQRTYQAKCLQHTLLLGLGSCQIFLVTPLPASGARLEKIWLEYCQWRLGILIFKLIFKFVNLGWAKAQGAELNQAQQGLGPGLKKFGLNIAHGGCAKGNMFYWGLQIKKKFENINLLGLLHIRQPGLGQM